MDARTSRTRRWLITGVTAFVTLVIVLVAVLALYDWNNARGWISAKVKERTGRDLVIGDLQVRPFSLHPRVSASGVTLSNAAWGDKAPMIDADSVSFSFSLPALLAGRVVFPQVTLGKAEVLLQRDTEGRRNWVLAPEEDKEGTPVQIQVLTVNDGRLVVRDPSSSTDVVLTLQSRPDATYGTGFTAKGRIKGYSFGAEGAGGGILNLRDATTPFPLKMTASVGEAKANFDGTVTGLVSLDAVDGRFGLAGRDLSLLADALNLSFPHTAPYKVAGRLRREGDAWRYDGFSGTVGNSDLRGDLAVDLASERPMLTGKLASKQLDIADLGGLVGERPGAPDPKPAGKVLPSDPIDAGKLQRIDANVSLVAGQFRNRDKWPLDNLNMTIVLKDGVMKADPLVFGVAGGELKSRIAVDARAGKTLAVDIDSAFRAVRINKLVPGTDMLDASFGAIDGKLKLQGKGDSAARVLATSNGRVDLVSRGGMVSNLLMEFAGADVGEIIRFFVGGDKTVQLRCGVAAFNVKDGVMTSEAFVIDTDDTYIGGEGAVSLRDETLDLKLTPLPKDVSILSLRGPLRVRGTFADPAIGLEKRNLAARASAAALLALIHPLAALIPTIETAPGKDKVAPCADLIASLEAAIKSDGRKPVPVKPPAP